MILNSIFLWIDKILKTIEFTWETSHNEKWNNLYRTMYFSNAAFLSIDKVNKWNRMYFFIPTIVFFCHLISVCIMVYKTQMIWADRTMLSAEKKHIFSIRNYSIEIIRLLRLDDISRWRILYTKKISNEHEIQIWVELGI